MNLLSKPKVAPNNNPNKRKSLSNRKSHQERKITSNPTIFPKHKYNNRNRIYSAPLNLANYVTLFAMFI